MPESREGAVSGLLNWWALAGLNRMASTFSMVVVPRPRRLLRHQGSDARRRRDPPLSVLRS